MADPAERKISGRALADHAVRAAKAHQSAKAARDEKARQRHAEYLAERAAQAKEQASAAAADRPPAQ